MHLERLSSICGPFFSDLNLAKSIKFWNLLHLISEVLIVVIFAENKTKLCTNWNTKSITMITEIRSRQSLSLHWKQLYNTKHFLNEKLYLLSEIWYYLINCFLMGNVLSLVFCLQIFSHAVPTSGIFFEWLWFLLCINIQYYSVKPPKDARPNDT